MTQPGGPFGSIAHIVVFGQNGTGTIQEVAATFNNKSVPVGVPAVLFAGSNNTILSAAGSSANNVLVGGAGNDTLMGGAGRDILIGGSGQAALHAGSGGDILLPGSTTYTPTIAGIFVPNVSALLALSAEWGLPSVPYQARIQALFAGSSGSANGNTLLNPATVLLSNAVDQLFATSNSDWLWFADNAKALDAIGNLPSGSIITFE